MDTNTQETARSSGRGYYVGINLNSDDTQRRRVFTSTAVPTEQSHGQTFVYVIGPFKTLAGACVMAHWGRANPHCRNVAEAERLARKRVELAREAIAMAERF